jgi:hypothetical protein
VVANLGKFNVSAIDGLDEKFAGRDREGLAVDENRRVG